MGLFRRRRKDSAATGATRARLPPLPPAGEPVIDPRTGIPFVYDEDLYDDEMVEEERLAPPAPEVHGLPHDAPDPVSEPGEALRRLDDLRDRGLLSAGEYDEQRRRVLGAWVSDPGSSSDPASGRGDPPSPAT